MPMVSRPLTTMEPVRRPTRPMIERNVEVRPAPLRPRSVTTSPLFTAKFTPCSTCDSPYQACRLETVRTDSATRGPRSIGTSHVRLDHLRVLRDLGIRALREDGAALQHGDRVADSRDHAHV